MRGAGDGGFCQRGGAAVKPSSQLPAPKLLDAPERDRPQHVRARADTHALAGLAALLLPTERAPDAGVLGFIWRSIFSHT